MPRGPAIRSPLHDRVRGRRCELARATGVSPRLCDTYLSASRPAPADWIAAAARAVAEVDGGEVMTDAEVGEVVRVLAERRAGR